MKKLLIWLPGMLSMLAACTEAVEIPARAPEKQSPVRVELHLTTEQQAATRAMDENCIRDVNLYLYGDTEYHFYFPSVSSPLVFNVLPAIIGVMRLRTPDRIWEIKMRSRSSFTKQR